MLKTCLRLLISGIVLFVIGIIGIAVLAVNGYDIDGISLPLAGESVDYGVSETAYEYEDFIAEFEADEIDSLDINVKAGDFTVMSGDKFSVSVNGANADCLKFSVSDKCLSATYSPEFYLFNFNFFNDDANIVITVPEKILESASFTVTAGELYVSDIETEKLALDLSAGESYFALVSASESAQIKMTAGECNLDGCFFNNANIKMTAGNMYYQGQIRGGSKIKMTAGDLYMDLYGRRSDYDINVDKTAGNVYINGMDFGRGEYAFTTVESILTEVTITGQDGYEDLEYEVSEEAAVLESTGESGGNSIDVQITAGTCNISFYND